MDSRSSSSNRLRLEIKHLDDFFLDCSFFLLYLNLLNFFFLGNLQEDCADKHLICSPCGKAHGALSFLELWAMLAICAVVMVMLLLIEQWMDLFPLALGLGLDHVSLKHHHLAFGHEVGIGAAMQGHEGAWKETQVVGVRV
ncbi:Uncharacterized protein TCM_040454 [Theobroma cacao]|uniref:Uncharacterized protein n=1 Tax=Theobroma cacao TaxID=3641 RepID=A0A061GSU5_THECC|nr:Uncharacterized protein TCM_040454 [Theobroma cacao]